MRFPMKPITDQSGQGLTEYLILLILVGVSAIVAANQLGGVIKRKLELAKRHVEKDIVIRGTGGSPFSQDE